MNPEHHSLTLSPAGLKLDVPAGTRLQEVLFAQGVEFPCGGRGRCKGCRVKVLRGELPIHNEEAGLLTRAELDAGWRLACRQTMTGDLALELAQWEMPVLTEHASFSFTPGDGLGIAIDLGTTTLAAQLLDLHTGNVLGVQTALNAQARHGADIMSRVEFALHGGQAELQRLIREQLGGMITKLLGARTPELRRVILVGNTVMHHLFCGLDLTPLAGHPFEPAQKERQQFAPQELCWDLPAATTVEFLPCLGGFVGSDLLAGIIATGLHESRNLQALLDLGTNGEVIIGHRHRILCTSTAAGPAFEGARIASGMRAATGAISQVQVENGALACQVIGGGEARGVCGSGLVDAIAAGLELKWIQPSGRLTNYTALPLAGKISLQQADVRELQLAKGAIAAGLRILTARFGAALGDIQQLHLAGAFGNYISRVSAQRIGLLNLPLERVVPAGNTALLGAKRALFAPSGAWDELAGRIEPVALNEAPTFQDIYAEEMRFPG